MKRFLQITDQYTRVFGYRINNSQLSLYIGILQLLVCLWSLTQHIYSLIVFKKILYCSFADNSTLPGMLTAVDAIIFDVGLFHALWGIHGCVAQHLDGGYGRFAWCCTHIISLCACLPFAFVRRPKPQFLWPMLIQQSTYGIGLLILSLAALPRVLPTLMGEMSGAPLHAILIYLIGTFMNFFLLYIYWHWYWHVEAQWESARKTRADQLQQNHSRRTGAITSAGSAPANGRLNATPPLTGSGPLPVTALVTKANSMPNGHVHRVVDSESVGGSPAEADPKAPLTTAMSNPPSTIEYWRNRQRIQRQQLVANGRLPAPPRYDSQPQKTTVLANSAYCERYNPAEEPILGSAAHHRDVNPEKADALVIRNRHFVDETPPSAAFPAERLYAPSAKSNGARLNPRRSFRSGTGSVPNETLALNPTVAARLRRASMQREPLPVPQSPTEPQPNLKQRHLMVRALQNASALHHAATTAGGVAAAYVMSLKRLPPESARISTGPNGPMGPRPMSSSVSMSHFSGGFGGVPDKEDHTSAPQARPPLAQPLNRASVKMRRESWRRHRAANVRPSSRTPPGSTHDVRKSTSTPSPSGSVGSAKDAAAAGRAGAGVDDAQLPPRVRRLKMEEAPRPQRRSDDGRQRPSPPTMTGSSSSGSLSGGASGGYPPARQVPGGGRAIYAGAPISAYAISSSVAAADSGGGDSRTALRRAMTHDGGGAPPNPAPIPMPYGTESGGLSDAQLWRHCELRAWRQKVADSTGQPYDSRRGAAYGSAVTVHANCYGSSPNFSVNSVPYVRPTVAGWSPLPYTVTPVTTSTKYSNGVIAAPLLPYAGRSTRKAYPLKERIHSSPAIRVDPALLRQLPGPAPNSGVPPFERRTEPPEFAAHYGPKLTPPYSSRARRRSIERPAFEGGCVPEEDTVIGPVDVVASTVASVVPYGHARRAASYGINSDLDDVTEYRRRCVSLVTSPIPEYFSPSTALATIASMKGPPPPPTPPYGAIPTENMGPSPPISLDSGPLSGPWHHTPVYGSDDVIIKRPTPPPPPPGYGIRYRTPLQSNEDATRKNPFLHSYSTVT